MKRVPGSNVGHARDSSAPACADGRITALPVWQSIQDVLPGGAWPPSSQCDLVWRVTTADQERCWSPPSGAKLPTHLGYEKHDPAGAGSGNSRKSVRSKTVQTEVGPVEIEVPSTDWTASSCRSSR